MKVSIYEEKSKRTGRSSLILITSDGHGNRTKKSLNLSFITNPTTIKDKQEMKDKKAMASLHSQDEERKINSYGFPMQEEYRFSEDFVTIPLNEDARLLLGERGKPENKVFTLPSHTSALKWLRRWTEDAGITKHITYHCSRHTFGTLLISNDVNLSCVSKLLGHSSVKTTERYTRVNDELKATAVGKLQSIINF